MQAGQKNALDCIEAFSETGFTEDLKTFDAPTLILHGDNDQIVPIGAAALSAAKLVSNAILKVYPAAPHGLFALWLALPRLWKVLFMYETKTNRQSQASATTHAAIGGSH